VPQVDVYLQPGLAIDGFGREIIVFNRTQVTQDLFAASYSPNPNANAVNMYIWIAYTQQFAGADSDVCAAQNISNANRRVQETFQLIVTTSPSPVPSLNDALVVDGVEVTPPAQPNPAPIPAPPPTPGQIVFPYDGSVPSQQFNQDDSAAHWYILLGQVLWHPHFQVFLQIASTSSGRQYVGVVAGTLEVPDHHLVIGDRTTPFPLPDDASYPGVAVEIAGTLTVDRLLTAWKDVDIPLGHLNFGSQVRQMINLWDVKYGIGVQDFTLYFRSDADFCWYRQGTHNNTRGNAGGGVLAMKLDDTSRLTITGDAIVNGRAGIGTATPGFKLDVADRARIRQGASGTAGIFFYQTGPAQDRAFVGMFDDDRIGLWGSVAGWSAVMNTNSGYLGVGTVAPGFRLDVGDRARVRQGPAGSAGIFFYQNTPNQDRAFVGMFDDNRVGFWGLNSGWGTVMDTNSGYLGVGTDAPAFRLDVNDRMRVRQGAGGTAGIFFYQTAPNQNRAFVGMRDDNNVGFWGSASGWAMQMNTNSGAVSLSGNIGTHGFDPDNGYPAGWAGGVHTWDVYAEGSIMSPNKYFLIDHPLDPKGKHLIHSTLEGPEKAVYYRGEAKLSKGKVTITLPAYFEALTRKEHRTVLLTAKHTGSSAVAVLAASDVEDGKFSVHANGSEHPNQEFYWEVKAVRKDVELLEVEVAKSASPQPNVAARPRPVPQP
jgi:hypothetical protein